MPPYYTQEIIGPLKGPVTHELQLLALNVYRIYKRALYPECPEFIGQYDILGLVETKTGQTDIIDFHVKQIINQETFVQQSLICHERYALEKCKQCKY